jgi:hypothetical protein
MSVTTLSAITPARAWSSRGALPSNPIASIPMLSLRKMWLRVLDQSRTLPLTTTDSLEPRWLSCTLLRSIVTS